MTFTEPSRSKARAVRIGPTMLESIISVKRKIQEFL